MTSLLLVPFFFLLPHVTFAQTNPLFIATPQTQAIGEPVSTTSLDIEPKPDFLTMYNETAHMVAEVATGGLVDPKIMLYIAQSESHMNTHAPDGDMSITCKRTGEPVRARGLFQITECYHPEITDTEAYDPMWSAKWATEQIRNGKCKKEFSTCPLANP